MKHPSPFMKDVLQWAESNHIDKVKEKDVVLLLRQKYNLRKCHKMKKTTKTNKPKRGGNLYQGYCDNEPSQCLNLSSSSSCSSSSGGRGNRTPRKIRFTKKAKLLVSKTNRYLSNKRRFTKY